MSTPDPPTPPIRHMVVAYWSIMRIWPLERGHLPGCGTPSPGAGSPTRDATALLSDPERRRAFNFFEASAIPFLRQILQSMRHPRIGMKATIYVRKANAKNPVVEGRNPGIDPPDRENRPDTQLSL